MLTHSPCDVGGATNTISEQFLSSFYFEMICHASIKISTPFCTIYYVLLPSNSWWRILKLVCGYTCMYTYMCGLRITRIFCILGIFFVKQQGIFVPLQMYNLFFKRASSQAIAIFMAPNLNSHDSQIKLIFE